MRIKNGLDISDLIKEESIKGENLSGAIIKSIYIIKKDIKNTNFHNAILGEEGKVNVISNSDTRNCNFSGTKFLGIFYFRKNDSRNCNFKNCYWYNVEYQYSDLRGCDFCNAIIRIGTKCGFNAKFDNNIFKDLTKNWNLSVKVRE